MAITRFDGYAAVQTDIPSVTVPLGTAWRALDLRIVYLSSSSSRAFTIPAGWTILHNSVTASRRVTVIARELQSGDTAPAIPVTGSAVSNVASAAVTVRGANNAAVLASTPAVQGSTATNSRNVTAPGVATGDGLLLTEHMVTRLDQTANTGAWQAPDGMATVASSLSDTNMGYNVLLAAESRSSGDSGVRTAIAGSAGAWAAVSMFLPAASTGGGSDTDVARNREPNPSAANDVTGYRANGTPTRVTGLAAPWPRATAARSPASAGGAYAQFLGSTLIATAPGEVWSGIVTVMASRAQQLQIGLTFYDATGAYVGADGNVFLDVAANTPQTINLTGVVPAGASTQVAVGLDLPAGAVGDLLTMGGVRLDQVTDGALPYRDGDSSGWGWDGTPGSSTSRRLGAVEPGRALLAVA